MTLYKYSTANWYSISIIEVSKLQKLVNQFRYFGCNISSTERRVNIRITKA